ncbi:MAG: PKD domain-containing protein [Gemmatimonadota bacterium]
MHSRRFSSSFAIVSLITGLGALLTACDSGPTGPTHFTILSPGESQVSVLPGQTVHFQVQLNSTGFRVEYQVDGEAVHEGPTFDFTPVLVEHAVRVSVIPIGSTAAPDVRDFTVGVAVPGNAPPSVSSFGHVPEIAEALRDTFTFNLSAVDTDGSLQRVVLDFGDDSDPVTLSGGLLGGAIQQEHVFPQQGTYEVRAIVFDDDGVAVDIRDTVEALPPNQFPTGSLTLQGSTEGDGPLAITIRTSGNDADGEIIKWELDTDQGDGFEIIQPNQTVQVSYAFRQDAYVPKLRLTDDDGDASVIEADEEILVFRQVSAGRSGVTATANATFANAAIAPAIWADGQDAFTVTVDVRDPDGAPLADVPVSLRVLRPDLLAPDARNLGSPVTISPADPRTNAQGRAIVLLRTTTSTRVEAAPEISFKSFDVEVEADRGHGEMVPLEVLEGLNAETIVGPHTGKVAIRSAGGSGGYCPGELVNISVDVDVRGGAPGAGGPARDRFTIVRTGPLAELEVLPTTPGPGFASWRTNGSGEIVLQYRPSASDQGRIALVWVDGQPLEDLKTFNFAPGC